MSSAGGQALSGFTLGPAGALDRSFESSTQQSRGSAISVLVMNMTVVTAAMASRSETPRMSQDMFQQ
jgi:hypothetical protein